VCIPSSVTVPFTDLDIFGQAKLGHYDGLVLGNARFKSGRKRLKNNHLVSLDRCHRSSIDEKEYCR